MMEFSMKEVNYLLLVFCIIVLSSCSISEPLALSTNPTLHTILAISDIHLDSQKSTATDYGDDTGSDLWKATQEQVVYLLNTTQPDFVIYLGDLPCHVGGNPTCADRDQDISSVLQDLRTTLTTSKTKSIPLFYVPGNNDSLAGDYDSFTDNYGKTPFAQDPNGSWPMIYGSATTIRLCDTDSPPCIINNQTQFGYYSAYPVDAGKVRLIVLNTVIFGRSYTAMDGTDHQDAIEKEISWFDEQIKDATTKSEKILIAMHIPPGIDGYSGKPMWFQSLDNKGNCPDVQSEFLNILSTSNVEVVGILTSHTHMDEIRQLYDANGNVIEVSLSVPGISPNHQNNPGMKIFQYDSSTFEITGSTTYYTGLPISSNSKATWQQYESENIYHCKANENIFDCTSTLSSEALAEDLYNNNYYSVRSTHIAKESNIESAIEVHP